MDNPYAPAGKAQKYARVERERRWLLAGPPDPVTATVEAEVTDVYFTGTRLRLRRIVDRRGNRNSVYKLTQKVEQTDAIRLVTNTYLSEAEYELFAKLDGDVICKIRYSVPPFGVDVFLPPLNGLVLAEAEFDSDEAMTAGVPPRDATAEVTDDARFTGGRLVATTRDELLEILAEFDLGL